MDTEVAGGGNTGGLQEWTGKELGQTLAVGGTQLVAELTGLDDGRGPTAGGKRLFAVFRRDTLRPSNRLDLVEESRFYIEEARFVGLCNERVCANGKSEVEDAEDIYRETNQDRLEID